MGGISGNLRADLSQMSHSHANDAPATEQALICRKRMLIVKAELYQQHLLYSGLTVHMKFGHSKALREHASMLQPRAGKNLDSSTVSVSTYSNTSSELELAGYREMYAYMEQLFWLRVY